MYEAQKNSAPATVRSGGAAPPDDTRKDGMTLTADVATDWMQDAACAGLDTEMFFDVGDPNDAYAEAREVCAPCPVRAECLTFALTMERTMNASEIHGYWGGTTAKQRLKMRAPLRVCIRCQEAPVTVVRARYCDPCAAERRADTKAAYDARKRTEQRAA